MKRKCISILAVIGLLILSLCPAAYAAEDEPGNTDTAAGSPIRIEVEGRDENRSGDGKGVPDTKDGRSYLEQTRPGDIFCLGDYDLTGLQTITLCVVHAETDGIQYGFYIDGTAKGTLGTKIATVTGRQTNGWADFIEASSPVTAPSARVAGIHTLFLKVEETDAAWGGNLDYVDLTFDNTRIEGENIDLDKSHTVGGATSRNTYLDATHTGDVLYLGEQDLTDLQDMVLCIANENNNDAVYKFYIDGNTDSLGTPIATITHTKTGSWNDFKEFKTSGLAVSAAQLAGKHGLFLSIAGETDGYTGNIDYVKLVKNPPINGVRTTAQSYSCYEKIDAEKSTGPYNRHDENKNIESTQNGTVLAFDNISFDGLTGIAINYAVVNDKDTTLTLRKSYSTDLGTYTLDKTQIGTADWWKPDNYRTTYFPITSNDLTGTDTLYFALSVSDGDAGNYRSFTLYYENEAQPVAVCQIEGENYVWGIGGTDWQQDSDTALTGVQSGDLFYLGKADLSDLQAITIRAATEMDSGVTCTFYADTPIDFSQLTTSGPARDQYTNRDAIACDSMGAVIAQIPIVGTKGWNTYGYFSSQATSGLTGPHDIYMQLTREEGDYTANIDYIRFAGLSEDSVDTSSNLMGNTTVVGGGALSTAGSLVIGQDTTVTATPADGYTLAGWLLNGDWKPAAENASLSVLVNGKNTVTAYFVKTGEEKVMLFYGKNNKLFDAQVVTTNLESAKAVMAQSLPKLPYIYGYEFDQWSESAEELQAALEADTLTLPVNALYKQAENTNYTYTVTVTNATATHGGAAESASPFAAKFDDRITVRAAKEEGAFQYWKLDDMVVSFDATYTFYVSGNNAITAVYDNDAGYSAEEKTVVRVQIKKDYITTETDGTNQWTVIAQMYVPSGTAIVEYGVIFAPGDTDLGGLDTLTEGTDYIKAAASSQTPNRQYMMSLRHIKPGKARQAMAYVTVRTTEGDRTYCSQSLTRPISVGEPTA